MAKNKKMSENEDVEIIEPDTQVEDTSTTDTPKSKKKNKEASNDTKDIGKQGKDKTKTKNAPKKEKKSLKKRANEVISELKKVSRPTFGKVVKNTCVVIAVVAVCTLLLFGVDRLFSLIYNLLLP